MVSRRVICRSAEAGGLSGAFPHRRWGRGRSGSSGPLERLSAGDNVRESGNLTKPEPELADDERNLVKALARDLFTHIEEALVLDWRKGQTTRAGVLVALEKYLDQLPDAYDPDLYKTKCGLVYEYVHSRES